MAPVSPGVEAFSPLWPGWAAWPPDSWAADSPVPAGFRLGSEGAWSMRGTERIFQPAFRVKAVDTTAAGDTFLGYFTAGMLAGESLGHVLWRAAKASSIAVSRPGAADSIPARDELE